VSSYGDLNEGEQAHWNEYTNLRQISNWPGFDAAQDKRRGDSRTWLQDRRAQLWNDLYSEPVDDAANQRNKRAQRYDFLKDQNLNTGAPKHEYRLPAPATCTTTEKVYIEEREVYLIFGSTTDAQKARKTANLTWLQDRRKQLWHLMKDDPGGNTSNDRQARYDALCVATHHGSVWTAHEKAHNKYGVPYSPPSSSTSSKGRSGCVSRAKSFVGVSENPANSNRGNPEPTGWQKRVMGFDGQPWCACFTTCMAWDAGIKGSGSAGVQQCINLAKQGSGIYRAFTTDKSRVKPGDHVAIGCSSCHIGMVAKAPDSSGCDTVEGNTSPGNSGSQYNGGCVATRRRSNSEIVGYLLVRFDD
jgi:hypothetical protein